MSNKFYINEGTVTKYAYISKGSVGLAARDISSTPFDWTESTILSTAQIIDIYGDKKFIGSNFPGDFDNVKKYKIYKTIGSGGTLYYLGELSSKLSNTFEDFAVGNNRASSYYIFPVMLDKDNGAELVKNPIISEPFTVNFGDISIIGLNCNEDGSYSVDYNNIWRFGLNVQHKGYAQNNDKVFSDNLGKYPKTNVGKRDYFTSQPIRGLIGRIDCDTSDYADSVELIEEWRQFSINGKPKLFRDIRGVMFICDIRDVSYDYDEGTNYINVSFTPVQLADLSEATINCKQFTYDAINYEVLVSNESSLLTAAIGNDIAAFVTQRPKGSDV